MSDSTTLQAENERLREQLEAYRLRELEALREELAEAKAQAAHYRSEAERNAALGHEIAREAEAERGRLMERINALERTSSVVRPERPSR